MEEGVNIRVELIKRARTQKWLIDELAKTGVETDKTELSKVLSGKRKGKKADMILRGSKNILRGFKQ